MTNKTYQLDKSGDKVKQLLNKINNLSKSDIGLDQVNNTSDTDKPVSTLQRQALNEVLEEAKAYADKEIAEFDFIKIVSLLPKTGLPNKIYLVPKTETEEQNLFDEYLWVNNTWEWISTKQIEVDLTDIYTKDETNELLDYEINKIKDVLNDITAEDISFSDGDNINITNVEDALNYLKELYNDIQTALEERVAVNLDYDDINSEISLLNAMGAQIGDAIQVLSSGISGIEVGTETDDEGNYFLVIYDEDGNELTKTKLPATGGGSGASTTTLKVERITPENLVIKTTDKAIVEYNCSSVDEDGETVSCSYTWKKGGTIIASGDCLQGKNTFELTDFVSIGTHKFTLTVVDEYGSKKIRTWSVQMIDFRIESSFNDQEKYSVGNQVRFTYTPYGAIDKTVHFRLDGNEIGTVITRASGTTQPYTLNPQTHGAHLLEVWMTATIGNENVESDHIYKDIIWYDETSDIPVIGCIYRYDYYGIVNTRQYNATNIPYVVYDPNEENPEIIRYVNGESIGTQITNKPDNIWSYKTSISGEDMLKIECGNTSVEIKLNVVELGITVEPVTANLAFDFNPVGRSNNDMNRIWSDDNTGVTMSVSDNFDWINGGYQRDENEDQYFCIKSGTSATINYELFGGEDPKKNGREFKFVFKTTNVKKRSSTFLSCIDKSIGIDMKIENAKIHASNKELFIPYCEDDIIEFEFNINKNQDIPMVMTYEDGVANRPMIYASDSSFTQDNPSPIVIGSEDCDVHIYRMKAYSTSLSDKEILSNFIADARNADEMIARYERNQIYDENNVLTPETFAEKYPDLRVIMVDCPWFTNDKDDKVPNTIIRHIYKGGRSVEDNWSCINARHSGQGTSSNNYGYAGRNLRLIMNDDESLFIFNGTDDKGNPITGKTITLTEDSIPNAFLNVKVNIASSENQNNSQFAQRYNEFEPFLRAARIRDPRVKDTMEFYNCVVFIRENEPDLSKHREFNDNEWHFYALGNVGDDKKTDESRVNDSKDPKECIVEITDYNVPMAEFPTGIGGNYIAPEQWIEGNVAYDKLHSEYTYEDGDFKSFGSESYEFRYEMKGITDQQREANINAWYDFYKFVVTSTDEEFVANFEDWFVLDSALYYYLFTERYLMVDNRAKNSFWHRGRVYITQAQATEWGEEKSKGYIVDDEKATINEGYRWDLTFGYDFDTSLGIDNTGKLVLTYGQEDVDKDASNAYIYRAAESNFFCRIRDLFADRLAGMYQQIETLQGWSSNDLIKQWDNAQNQFPEEIWRLDVERKYIRTYLGKSIDNSIIPQNTTDNPAATTMFLEPMLNGRKKYQRRQFERNQELYMATKYFGKVATQDYIMMRFNNPVGASIAPDFTLYITPYSDMYIGTSFGNVTPTNFRAKAGVEYTIPCSIESGTADITLLYGASFIQAIGDLSKCYVGSNDFSKASRLQSLVIGSNVEGYENTFMTNLALGNNKLLEHLDIRNVTGFTKAEGAKDPIIDLSNCNNLVELRAESSTISSVIFADGGKLKEAYIPDVKSLTMKNLHNLETFEVEGYNNLLQLIVENISTINTYNIVNSAPNLNRIRMIGIDWDKNYGIENTDILTRMCKMKGIDSKGYDIENSAVTGYVFVPTLKQSEEIEYKNIWGENLEIGYNTYVEQYEIKFLDDDGETVLYTEWVSAGGAVENPKKYFGDSYKTPTKATDERYNYVFEGWKNVSSGSLSYETDDVFVTHVGAPITYKAQYVATEREFTVTWVNGFDDTPLKTATVKYGTEAVWDFMPPLYNKDGENIGGDGIPTYTGAESYLNFYLFKGWNKSTGYVTDNMTVTAVWNNDPVNADKIGALSGAPEPREEDSTQYLNNASWADLYRICAGYPLTINNYIKGGDRKTFRMGNDYSFENVTELDILEANKELFGQLMFGGSLYLDGSKSFKVLDGEGKPIELFGEKDKSFTMCLDYEYTSTDLMATIMSICNEDNNSVLLKLQYNNGHVLNFGSNNKTVGYSTYRNMIVIRHIKGEDKLYIYSFNPSNTSAYKDAKLTEALVSSVGTSGNLVLGGIDLKTQAGQYGKGFIHKCKIWYADLGDYIAQSICDWTTENVVIKAASSESGDVTGRYALSDNTLKTSSVSFMFEGLLMYAHRMNIDSYNYSTSGGEKSDGYYLYSGWHDTQMRKFLNPKHSDCTDETYSISPNQKYIGEMGRFYKGLPVQLRALIKRVKTYANVGGSAGNSDTTPVRPNDDYIYLPCLRELGGSGEPYNREGDYKNTLVANSDIYRAKYLGYVVPEGATYYSNTNVAGATTCSADPTTSHEVKTGDVWQNGTAVYVYEDADICEKFARTADGTLFVEASGGGLWVRSSNWWMRSPNAATSSHFYRVEPTGKNSNNGVSSYASGVCPCFSIGT